MSACSAAGSSAPYFCPPLAEYSISQQLQAAEELRQLPEKAMLAGMMADYALLRDQLRACTASQ
ncbi:MAG: hypothetical protein AB7G80_04915 [Dongiaceae bacterium]